MPAYRGPRRCRRATRLERAGDNSVSADTRQPDHSGGGDGPTSGGMRTGTSRIMVVSAKERRRFDGVRCGCGVAWCERDERTRRTRVRCGSGTRRSVGASTRCICRCRERDGRVGVTWRLRACDRCADCASAAAWCASTSCTVVEHRGHVRRYAMRVPVSNGLPARLSLHGRRRGVLPGAFVVTRWVVSQRAVRGISINLRERSVPSQGNAERDDGSGRAARRGSG
jgi:hypothetical protein